MKDSISGENSVGLPEVVVEGDYVRKNHLPVCEFPLLSLQNLCYSYPDGTSVLKNVTLDICDIPRHGQVVAFVGPSGVGKTTLMNIITGTIEEGFSGEALVYDDVLQKKVQIRAGMVGKVTQDYWFAPFYTVGQNLEMAAAKNEDLSKEKQQAKVTEMLDRFGMSEFRNRYRGQLSGGQKQRVAIMIQLLCSKHYIVLDEPFTGLDMVMKEDLAKLIREAADADEYNTFFIVTHEVTYALVCSDTIYLMGRDFDAEGRKLPGANIKKGYDLQVLGIAYQPDVMQLPAYNQVLRDVRAEFPRL
jgi:ABC-type nitrate/sulfonate/bicarbonate transport system ATPase subunit